MAGYKIDPDRAIEEALKAGVDQMICVGEDLKDSKQSVDFVKSRSNVWSSIGIHPHHSSIYSKLREVETEFKDLLKEEKVVAVGECGLDYFYEHSSKIDQKEMLEFQLNIARENNLPVIFHVRDAFQDFWPILDNFPGVKGVVHSFTADITEMKEAIKRNLYLGLNGIVTFTKDNEQLNMVKQIPIDNILLETDAPFLTPTPYRGNICQPKHVRTIAEFIAELRKEPLDELASSTSKNAIKLFNLK